tara:strand:- start:60354 stop:60686 length:333 start_codon:yes stop_codon:yes gene_type:complete
MNVNELKKIISECMQEMNENAMGFGMDARSPVQPTEQNPEIETNVQKQNWSELINTCVHDPHSKFLETYFIPALSASRETVGAVLEALADNEDIQKEIYKALDEFEYKKG